MNKKEFTLLLAYLPYAKNRLFTLDNAFLRGIRKKEDFLTYFYYYNLVKSFESLIKQLPLDEKEILIFRYFDNKTLDEISVILGYANHSSVQKKLNKIINTLWKLYSNKK
ncbi:MAG: sigma factor-like helix-turn-helix DNA-binding protein [Coprobacillaceae bacterium]